MKTCVRALSRRSLLQSAALITATASLPHRLLAAGAPRVETSAGTLEGVQSNGVNSFKGVPYGAPTGGKARFKPPQPAAKWAGVKQAVAYGPAAPQGASMLQAPGVLERIKALVPPQQAAQVLETYKRTYPGMLPSDILFRVQTDRSYFLDSTIQASRKADLGKAPAFLYSFYWMQPLAAGRVHSPHGSEIAFAFANDQFARGDNPQALVSQMSEAWAAFARTGNPGTRSLRGHRMTQPLAQR